jgi:tetratricopeptide (TPR) repeat protein
VSGVEGELRGIDEASTATIESADRFLKYVTYVGGAIGLILTAGASIGAFWFRSNIKQVEQARQDVVQIEKEVEQTRKAMSSAIAITRAVPALLRSNVEEKEPARKRLHAEEAYLYLRLAEDEGHKDSHLLNWKAYTLRRMDRKKQALEAAQEALTFATNDNDPQKARAHYNIACYQAFFGDYGEALISLDRAILCVACTKKSRRPIPILKSSGRTQNSIKGSNR